MESDRDAALANPIVPGGPLADAALDVRELLPEPATHVRYWVLLALSVAVACAYLTRVLGAVNTTIRGEFGFTNQEMGYVLAGFFAGYFWFQIPGGWVANRIGVRIMLPAIALVWSLATVCISLATSGFEMQAARFVLGLAQAPIMPCVAKVIGDWIPDRERGRASAAIGVSMSVGSVAAAGLTASLLPILPWREIFLIYASLSILWAYAFFRWFRNQPADQPSTNQAERDLILAGNPDAAAKALRGGKSSSAVVSTGGAAHAPAAQVSAVSLFVSMATSAGLWAVCLLAFFRAFGFEFFAAWFPAYLEKGRGVLVVHSGLLTMAPLIAVGAGALFGGWVVDRLLRTTRSRRISRSSTAMVSLTVCALSLLAAAWVTNAGLAVAMISFGAFFFGISGPAAWAATLDIGGTHKAVVFAIMNMVGNLGAMACQPTVGGLFDYINGHHADWNLLLYLFFAIGLAGAACAAVLNPNRSAVDHSLIPLTVD